MFGSVSQAKFPPPFLISPVLATYVCFILNPRLKRLRFAAAGFVLRGMRHLRREQTNVTPSSRGCGARSSHLAPGYDLEPLTGFCDIYIPISPGRCLGLADCRLSASKYWHHTRNKAWC